MLGRKKRNTHETPEANSSEQVPRAVETRPFHYLTTDAEGRPLDPTANSKEGLHYVEADANGEPIEVREIVTSFTQLPEAGKRRNLLDINDYLRKEMAPAVAAQMPENAQLTGLCVVEHPVEPGLHGPIQKGFAFETSGVAKMRLYEFMRYWDESGREQISIGKKTDITKTSGMWDTNQPIPPGSRITSSVRGEVPLSDVAQQAMPTVEEPSYERYLTASMRGAINHADSRRSLGDMPVKEAEAFDRMPLRIPADEGRPFSIRPEHQGMPERPSRVSFGEPVELSSGKYNAYSSIASHTVPHSAQATYPGISETFGKMKDELEGGKPQLAGIKAQCLIEYPRENEHDPIDAVVVVQSRDKMVAYTIQETEHGIKVSERTVIHDEGRGRKKRGKSKADTEALKVPAGSRITYEVRGRQPANGAQLAEKKSPYEVVLMTRVRYAIEDYDEANRR